MRAVVLALADYAEERVVPVPLPAVGDRRVVGHRETLGSHGAGPGLTVFEDDVGIALAVLCDGLDVRLVQDLRR